MKNRSTLFSYELYKDSQNVFVLLEHARLLTSIILNIMKNH